MADETIMIQHDQAAFIDALKFRLNNPENGGVMDGVDVVASDSRPDELMLVILCPLSRNWYSDAVGYINYKSAFSALGVYIDDANPHHLDLSDNWAS